MRRVLSILLMVVMVLAPCAVVHAASMGSAPHMMSASDQSHGEHVDCHAGQQGPGHSVCSSDCDTLQRAAETIAPQRSFADFKAAYPTIVFALGFVLTSPTVDSAPDKWGGLLTIFDPKTVLRQNARLRL